jgi:hypothetical protein
MQIKPLALMRFAVKPMVEFGPAKQRALNHYAVLFGLTWLTGLLIVTIFLTAFDGSSVPGAR